MCGWGDGVSCCPYSHDHVNCPPTPLVGENVAEGMGTYDPPAPPTPMTKLAPYPVSLPEPGLTECPARRLCVWSIQAMKTTLRSFQGVGVGALAHAISLAAFIW